MAYIGSPPAYQASGVRPRDEFTADGTQICFPLSQSVPGSFESGVTIVLDNVPQQPVEAFTVVDTRTLTLTSISGTFTVNETITGATSAATGVVLKVNLNNIVIRGLTGTFSSSENITGGTSAATATTTSVTINEGSGILFSEAPTAASILYVVHEGNATYNLVPTAASVGPSQLSDNLRNFTVDTFTGNGSTTTFTLSDTPSSANSLLVMVDGIVQTRTTNYTLSGAIVTFTDAPDSSAAITIIHLGFSTISRTGLVDGSVTTAKIADNAITSAKLGFDVIVAEDIAANAITVAEISNGAVTSAKLDTNISITNLAYTGTLTGGTGVVNLGSGQVYKDSSGNVGIGTSSPASKLDVAGTITTSQGITYNGVSTMTIDQAVNAGAMILRTGTSSYMRFDTNGSNERMRIDSSGNVGIGTSSPTYGTLEVAQGSAGVVSVINNTVGAWAFRKVRSDGSNGMGIYDASGYGVPAFYASGSERMRIDSSGKLLVGTTSENPGYGNTNTGAQLSNNGSHFSRAATDWVMTVNQNTADGSARYLIGFRVSNGQVGNIQSDGSNCTYNSTSDYRLKENIAPMTGALAKVEQLKPVTYKWKKDGSDGQGFIAHELQAVVPDCVTGEKDAVDEEGNPRYQGIDTSFLVATLTAAIQELKAEFDEYKRTHP